MPSATPGTAIDIDLARGSTELPGARVAPPAERCGESRGFRGGCSMGCENSVVRATLRMRIPVSSHHRPVRPLARGFDRLPAGSRFLGCGRFHCDRENLAWIVSPGAMNHGYPMVAPAFRMGDLLLNDNSVRVSTVGTEQITNGLHPIGAHSVPMGCAGLFRNPTYGRRSHGRRCPLSSKSRQTVPKGSASSKSNPTRSVRHEG